MSLTYKTDNSFFSYVSPIGTNPSLYAIFKWFQVVDQAKFRFIKDIDIEDQKMNLQQVDELYPEVKIFGVVNNPWTRVYNFYRDFTQHRGRNSIEKLIEVHDFRLDSFESFVLNLPNSKKNPDSWFGPTTPHCEWVQYRNRQVDYLFKAETLEEDFKVIQEYFCTDVPLMLQKNTVNYREHFTDEMRKAVEELFKVDIEKFGYSF
jgi:hypothetical protein